MAKALKQGDAVMWKSHAGEAHGHVVRKLVKPVTIKGHTAAASEASAQFLVETHDGKRAAHKRSALTKE